MSHVSEFFLFFLHYGTSAGGAVKHISCGCRHIAQKYIQNTKYKSTHGGLCYSCYDEELFKSGSRKEKEAERVFPNKNVAKSLHVCPRDESLVHFSLGAPTNKSSGCFPFWTLAADVFMGLLHFADEHIYTIFPNFPIVCVAGLRCFALGRSFERRVPGVW